MHGHKLACVHLASHPLLAAPLKDNRPWAAETTTAAITAGSITTTTSASGYKDKAINQDMSRIILIPGNGNDQVETSMWYPSAVLTLADAKDPETGQHFFGGGAVLKTFPDPYDAHEDIWIRFMENDIEINESDVVIGHSSGAAAILRFIESRKVKGVVLVSAYHTDLGDISEVIITESSPLDVVRSPF